MTELTELAKRGGPFGAVAYVVGYVLTFVLYSLDDNLGTKLFDGSQVDSLTGTGWVYYNAHFSDLTMSIRTSTETRTGSVNVLTDSEVLFSGSEPIRATSWSGTSLPEPLFFLVPVAALAGAGYVFVQRTPVRSAREAAKHGGAIVAGYFPLALFGALIFAKTWSAPLFQGSTTLELNLMSALVLAGLLWPLLFGAIGGSLWFKFNGTTSPNVAQRRPSRGR